MTDIIGQILNFLITGVVAVVGFCLSFVFIFIPTVTLDPATQIPYIEKDLCIDFPEKYEVKKKYGEYLAFEENIELTFEFDDEQFKNLINQTIKENCANGTWEKQNQQLKFIKKYGFTDNNKYIFEAWITDNTLEYQYSSM
jgi:hypothetical protein